MEIYQCQLISKLSMIMYIRHRTKQSLILYILNRLLRFASLNVERINEWLVIGLRAFQLSYTDEWFAYVNYVGLLVLMRYNLVGDLHARLRLSIALLICRLRFVSAVLLSRSAHCLFARLCREFDLHFLPVGQIDLNAACELLPLPLPVEELLAVARLIVLAFLLERLGRYVVQKAKFRLLEN